MILSVIFHFLKVVFGYAIKIVAWLLVSLSLWVPLVYTLIFVIACGLSGASLTALKSWYFAGLAVSFIGSFAISSYIYERGLKNKKRQKKASSNIEKVKEAEVAPQITAKQPGPQFEKPDNQILAEPESTNNIIRQAKADSAAIMPSGERPINNTDGGVKPYSDTAAKHGFYGYEPNNIAGHQQEQRTLQYPPNKNGFDYDAVNSSSDPTNFKYGVGYNSEGAVDRYGAGRYGIGETAYDKNNSGGTMDNHYSGGYNNSGTNNRYGFNEPSNNEYDTGINRGGMPQYGESPAAQPYKQSPVSGDLGFDRSDGFGDSERGFMRPEYPFAKNDGGFNVLKNESDYDGNKSDDSYGGFDVPVSGGRSFEEKPRIFATRSDPTVFIYEYADRLEYYKRTRSGMVFMNSKPKAANE